jgi:hypothetical protein
MTVEEINDAEIDEAFDEAQRAGSPAIRREVIEGDTAGYHSLPGPRTRPVLDCRRRL